MLTKENIEKLEPYPAQVLKIATTLGFIEEFYNQCAHHPTAKDAFWFINDQHQRLFGSPKFADYHTFKNVRNRINKKFLDKNRN